MANETVKPDETKEAADMAAGAARQDAAAETARETVAATADGGQEERKPEETKRIRELPSAVELSEEQYGRIVKRSGSAAAAEKQKRRKWNPAVAKKHEEILTLLRQGVTTRVIHTKLGVPRSTIMAYIDGHDDLKEAYRDAQEDMLDLSEEIVNEIATLDCEMQQTDSGNFPRYDGRTLATKFNAAKFRLERMGAKRGWGAKLETNEVGNGGGRTPVIFMGQFTEEMIADADAEVRRANEEAMKGLEGIPHG